VEGLLDDLAEDLADGLAAIPGDFEEGGCLIFGQKEPDLNELIEGCPDRDRGGLIRREIGHESTWEKKGDVRGESVAILSKCGAITNS